MKFSSFILVITFIVTALFIVNSYNEQSKPQVTVEQNCTLPALKGDLISFTFKIKSNEPLKSINIIPSIPGANEDCYVEYSFDEETKTATVNYFYTVSEKLSQVDSITITLDVQDSNSTVQVSEVIPVYNPPLMASMIESTYENII